MKKNYNYFYKITNLINNKFYYGVHKTDNIYDGYMGSGTRLKYAYNKYGIENFKKEILKYFNTYDDALLYESNIVTEKLVNDDNCYNLKIGGKGGNGWIFANTKNIKTTVIDEKTKKCIRVEVNSDYYKNTENYDFFAKNKVVVIDSKGDKHLIDKNDERYLSGELIPIRKNKVMVKNNKNEFFIINKNDKRYLNGELKHIWVGRIHKNETKEKMKLSHKMNNHQKGSKNSQFGTCWIYNDILKENKKVKKDNLNIWLDKGWVKGRKIKF